MTALRFVRLTFFVNLITACVVAVICLFVGGLSLLTGAVIGGAVGSVNLLLIGLIAVRLFTSSGDGGDDDRVLKGRGRMLLLLGLKSLLLIAGALALAAFLDVSGIGLAAGLFASVAAVMSTSLFVAVTGGQVEL